MEAALPDRDVSRGWNDPNGRALGGELSRGPKVTPSSMIQVEWGRRAIDEQGVRVDREPEWI